MRGTRRLFGKQAGQAAHSRREWQSISPVVWNCVAADVCVGRLGIVYQNTAACEAKCTETWSILHSPFLPLPTLSLRLRKFAPSEILPPRCHQSCILDQVLLLACRLSTTLRLHRRHSESGEVGKAGESREAGIGERRRRSLSLCCADDVA